MGIFDKYGPNTQQVKRFIERVKTLTPEQRESTEFEEQLSKSAFGSANTYLVQVASTDRYGKDHEEKWLGPATKALGEATAGLDARFRMRTNFALMALALCDGVMNAEEFSTWYGPLARVIPIDSLGEGLAPKIAPASFFPPERFVTRVRRLDNWRGFESAHGMLLDAVGGNERHGAALQAVEPLLNKVPDGEYQKANLESLSKAFDEVQKLGIDRSQQLAGVWDMIGSSLQREGVTEPSDWAERMTNWHKGQDDFNGRVRHCCFDGIMAVAFVAELAIEHWTYLYVPFEGVIPIDSVLFP
jgi:hypothetical protein